MSDHRAGGLATGSGKDGKGPTRPFEMPDERGEASVECLQACDLDFDLGATFADDAGQFGRHVRAVSGVTPAGDPRGIVERNVEPAQVDQQAQMFDVRLAVLAIGVVSPLGAR